MHLLPRQIHDADLGMGGDEDQCQNTGEQHHWENQAFSLGEFVSEITAPACVVEPLFSLIAQKLRGMGACLVELSLSQVM